MPDLNPQQFPPLYHGTAHPLEGDTLTPGRKFGSGADPNSGYGQSTKDVVSASEQEEVAWKFAALSGHNGAKGRTQVHVVDSPHAQVGIEHPDHPVTARIFEKGLYNTLAPENHEWVAPSFHVQETLDIKPGQQGTFPQENWNRYKQRGHERGYTDANHPPSHALMNLDGSKPPRRGGTVPERRLGAEMAKDVTDEIVRTHKPLF